MSAGLHNIALAHRFMQSLTALNLRVAAADVRILKATITGASVQFQLSPQPRLPYLFPEAKKRQKGEQHFYECEAFGSRIVWEATNDH